jgi:hypothetical protein
VGLGDTFYEARADYIKQMSTGSNGCRLGCENTPPPDWVECGIVTGHKCPCVFSEVKHASQVPYKQTTTICPHEELLARSLGIRFARRSSHPLRVDLSLGSALKGLL